MVILAKALNVTVCSPNHTRAAQDLNVVDICEGLNPSIHTGVVLTTPASNRVGCQQGANLPTTIGIGEFCDLTQIGRHSSSR